jgi:hypothetical protein
VDVTKTPPPGPPPARSSGASASETASQPPAGAAVASDRADIGPLDVRAALRILLAEVRASFELTALSMGSDAGTPADNQPQAARAILQVFLQAVPEDAPSMPAWTAAVGQAEAALQSGLDQGIAAVSAWRDVSPVVVDAAKETQALIFAALNEDAQNPALMRLEWTGFAPRLESFRRRRRFARRRLTDPDYPERNIDDGDKYRP